MKRPLFSLAKRTFLGVQHESCRELSGGRVAGGVGRREKQSEEVLNIQR